MALFERLMNLADDGVSPAPKESEDPTLSRIPVHVFWAACSEVIAGEKTVAQVKTFFNMNQAAQDEFDSLIATAPSGTTNAANIARRVYLDSIHAVMLLAEKKLPTYSTPDELRTRFGV